MDTGSPIAVPNNTVKNHPSGDDGDGDGDGVYQQPDSNSRTKRRKISTACEPCRARKARCDGERPVCGPCGLRSHDPRPCEYSNGRKRDRNTTSTPELLQRIRDLERRLESTTPNGQLPHESPDESDNDHSASTAYRVAIQRDGMSSQINLLQVSEQIPPNSSNGLLRSSTSPYAQQIPSRGIGSIAYDRPKSEFGRDGPSISLAEVPLSAAGATSWGSSRPTGSSNSPYGGLTAVYSLNPVPEPPGKNGLGVSQHQSAQLPRPSPVPTIARNLPSLSSILQSPEEFVLPARQLSDQLFDIYWKKCHNLSPFLHKSCMEQTYGHLWENSYTRRENNSLDLGLGSTALSDETTRIFHCALNAIFALASQLAPPDLQIQDRHGLSERFFLRSQELLHFEPLEHGSLSLVQTFLIMTQYLQSTQSPSRCWNSLGLACRLGQGLGLHIEDHYINWNLHEKEIRRRIWHGCNTMDIVASTVLGRPMLTYQHNPPLPSALHGGDYTQNHRGTTVDGQYETPVVNFYVESIKLCHILATVVTNVYKPRLSSPIGPVPQDSCNDIQAVTSLAESLCAYEEAIESKIHWDRGKQERDNLPEMARKSLQTQSNVLHARYLHTQLLLHRPSFLRTCRKYVSTSKSGTSTPTPAAHHTFSSNLSLQSSIQCIIASIDLISALNESVNTDTAGEWWFTTSYLYASGIILILFKSCNPMHPHFSTERVDASWNECITVLKVLSRHGASPDVALTNLCAMYDRLVYSGQPAPQLLPNARPLSLERRSEGSSNPRDGVNTPPFRNSYQEVWPHTQSLIDFLAKHPDTTLPGTFEDTWWGIPQLGL